MILGVMMYQLQLKIVKIEFLYGQVIWVIQKFLNVKKIDVLSSFWAT